VIERLVDLIIERRGEGPAAPPFVVGIAGGVGVGKTTLANTLAQHLTARAVTVAVLATDNFLHPNAALAERGLLMQKGFPATYDVELIRDTLATLRRGASASVPMYDHGIYDVLPDRVQIAPTDVLLLEGVNVLQPEIAQLLDLSMYIDVDVEHARGWFLHRFAALCDQGVGFYAPFSQMTAEEREAIAESAWSGINLVNLERHIAPTMAAAAVVIRKEADHSIAEVRIA